MLKSDVAIRLGNEFGDAITDGDLIILFNQWIDEAYLNICSEFNWMHKVGFFDLPTVAGQAEYDLDTLIRRIIVIKNITTNQEIIFRSYKDLVDDGLELTQQSQIYWWHYVDFTGFGTSDSRHYKIRFTYIPDSIYQLQIQAEKASAESLATNEHIPIPSELLPALYAYVRKLSHLHEDMSDGADRWNNEYMTQITKYKLYLAKNPADPVRSPHESDLHYGRSTYMPFLQYPTNITGG